jgi:hypothetical protein
MILPTKHLSDDKALISVGSVILAGLNRPKSVSQLWSELAEGTEEPDGRASLTFDWFILALDFLFTIDAIQIQDGLLRRGLP